MIFREGVCLPESTLLRQFQGLDVGSVAQVAHIHEVGAGGEQPAAAHIKIGLEAFSTLCQITGLYDRALRKIVACHIQRFPSLFAC